ncbi:Hypothetical protein SCF082_LOCUS17854 [Durusdinium trenchii]|uniref:Uncharacterized protein n=1 Tax=Durusdinium trenchii TaxID=1381693 RepID=A0ABP0KKV7_9DINO
MLILTSNDDANIDVTMSKWFVDAQLLELRRVSGRFMMQGVLRGSVMMNLQITIFSAQAAAAGSPSPLSFVNIALMFPVAMFVAYTENYKAFRIASLILQGKHEAREEEDIEETKRQTFHRLLLLAVANTVNSCLLLYCALKLYMAWKCKHHMWNVSGCVE